MTSPEICTLEDFLTQLNALREAYGKKPLEHNNMRLSLRKVGAWIVAEKKGLYVYLDKAAVWEAYNKYLSANHADIPKCSKKEAMQKGLYSIEMLFAAINALREITGIRALKTVKSLQRVLNENAHAPACVCDKAFYYKPAPLIAFYTQEAIPKGGKTKGDYFTAGDEEINSGDWHELRTVSMLTAVKKARITSAGLDGRIMALIHPETGDLLYSLKQVQEELSYRSYKWLVKVVGEEAARFMLKTRRTKVVYLATMIYAPEFRHL